MPKSKIVFLITSAAAPYLIPALLVRLLGSEWDSTITAWYQGLIVFGILTVVGQVVLLARLCPAAELLEELAARTTQAALTPVELAVYSLPMILLAGLLGASPALLQVMMVNLMVAMLYTGGIAELYRHLAACLRSQRAR